MAAFRSLSNWHGWRVVIASTAMQNLAFMYLWLQPAVVDELVTHAGLSVSQVGLIATVETLTVSIILLLAVRWRRPVLYAPIALAGIATILLTAIGCMLVTSFTGFLVLIFTAALGFGLLMMVSHMALAGFEKADMVFGRVYAVNLMFSAALLFMLPYFQSLFGRPPAFPAMVLFALAMLPFVLLMPWRECSPARELIKATGGRLPAGACRVLLLAAGSAAVGLAYGQVWAFFMFLGQKAGLSAAQASTASGLALAGAIVGSLLAGRANSSRLSLRLFRLSIAGSAVGLLAIASAPLPGLFVAGGIAAMFGMYFFFPTILGVAANHDFTGRGIALINGALSFCTGVGPMIAGVLIEAGGTAALIFGTMTAMMLSLLLFELVWRAGGRAGPAPAAG